MSRARLSLATALITLLPLSGGYAQQHSTHPAPPPTLDDATIVAIFDAANTADIETARLGAAKATDQRVRDLGKHFAADHENVRQQGRDLAKRLGVTPTPPADHEVQARHQAAMQRLQGLKGADFDRAFLDHEIAYHQAVIDAVTSTLLPAIHNPDLKSFVEQVAPAFRGHLEQAKAVRKALGN